VVKSVIERKTANYSFMKVTIFSKSIRWAILTALKYYILLRIITAHVTNTNSSSTAALNTMHYVPRDTCRSVNAIYHATQAEQYAESSARSETRPENYVGTVPAYHAAVQLGIRLLTFTPDVNTAWSTLCELRPWCIMGTKEIFQVWWTWSLTFTSRVKKKRFF